MLKRIAAVAVASLAIVACGAGFGIVAAYVVQTIAGIAR